MSGSIDPGLAFRQAAANNDTATMIKLYPSVNINASGATSKQTAAHRASAAGNSAALRLLFNLGADLTLGDKDEKRAEELAVGEAKKIFSLIKAGTEAVAFRKRIFPKIDEEASEGELNVFTDARKNFVPLSYESPELKKFWESITKSQKSEMPNCYGLPLDKVEAIEKKAADATDSSLYRLSVLKCVNYFVRKKCSVCRCGEATEASLAYLFQANIPFPVEELHLFWKGDKLRNHAIIILNRIQDKEISDTSSWNEALFVDPYKKRLFFFDFLAHYKENTVIKDLTDYTLTLGSRNVLAAYPDIFPKTAALYQRQMDALNKEIQDLVASFK